MVVEAVQFLMYIFILVYEVMEFFKIVMEFHFPDLCGNPVTRTFMVSSN